MVPNVRGIEIAINPSSAIMGLFRSLVNRRLRWGLSWRGWGLLGLAVLLAGTGLVRTIHPFLAVTKRVNTKVLVVEGWTHDFGVDGAVKEFKRGHYERILTTGGPDERAGLTSSIYDTDAYQSAELLRKAGLTSNEIQSVPAVYVGRDRTYNSALALRTWLLTNAPTVDKINVLTEDAHARRTWLLFKEALGPDMKVGIISVPNPDYDANHWWRSSDGVREVIDESIAYLYAKFFFWPQSQP